ncbi:MAG: hypothetical protein QHI38_13815 [Armatimonadota bacterium]|nr:hypothetical protein [Armatimonadota bacterium]
MLSVFQFATVPYLSALLPSIYTVRRHLPHDSRLHVSLFLRQHESVAPGVQAYLDALGVVVEIVRVPEDQMSRESVLSRCNRQFLRLVQDRREGDVFYLDADCYLRRELTWVWTEGDVIFGSRESAREQAARSFPDFCRRLGVGFLWNRDYCGSCVYVKEHARASYGASLERLLNRNVPFVYFDDMHYRLAAAYLSGLRIGVVPRELEYKVVFGSSKSEDPEMLHLCFSVDWYRKDRCYPWFLRIIREFLAGHPHLTVYLPERWIEDAHRSAGGGASGLESRGLNVPVGNG